MICSAWCSVGRLCGSLNGGRMGQFASLTKFLLQSRGQPDLGLGLIGVFLLQQRLGVLVDRIVGHDVVYHRATPGAAVAPGNPTVQLLIEFEIVSEAKPNNIF